MCIVFIHYYEFLVSEYIEGEWFEPESNSKILINFTEEEGTKIYGWVETNTEGKKESAIFVLTAKCNKSKTAENDDNESILSLDYYNKDVFVCYKPQFSRISDGGRKLLLTDQDANTVRVLIKKGE